MVNVQDFTSLPRGFEVPLEGRVETRPRCGRNGIEEHPECGHPYFVGKPVTVDFSFTPNRGNRERPASGRGGGSR